MHAMCSAHHDVAGGMRCKVFTFKMPTQWVKKERQDMKKLDKAGLIMDGM